jgi:hypothetical protein
LQTIACLGKTKLGKAPGFVRWYPLIEALQSSLYREAGLQNIHEFIAR